MTILISGYPPASHLFGEASFKLAVVVVLLGLQSNTYFRASQQNVLKIPRVSQNNVLSCLTSCITISGAPIGNLIVAFVLIPYTRKVGNGLVQLLAKIFNDAETELI